MRDHRAVGRGLVGLRGWSTAKLGALIGLALVTPGVCPIQASALPAGGVASVDVEAAGQHAAQTGVGAAQSVTGTETTPYIGSPWGGYQQFQASTWFPASASAAGTPNDLLQVRTAMEQSDPGVISRVLSGFPDPVQAVASWTNDRLTVVAPQGMSLPATVRLQFALNFNLSSAYYSPDGWFGTRTLDVNGQTHTLPNMGGMYYGDSKWYDSYTTNPPPGPYGRYIEPPTGGTITFHIDLPVNHLGVSGPFSLGLTATPFTGLLEGDYTEWNDATLTLTGVTLPDGTSLADLGDRVTFASGLSIPTPAPEPATLAAWLLGAMAGLRLSRGKRAGAPKR